MKRLFSFLLLDEFLFPSAFFMSFLSLWVAFQHDCFPSSDRLEPESAQIQASAGQASARMALSAKTEQSPADNTSQLQQAFAAQRGENPESPEGNASFKNMSMPLQASVSRAIKTAERPQQKISAVSQIAKRGAEADNSSSRMEIVMMPESRTNTLPPSNNSSRYYAAASDKSGSNKVHTVDDSTEEKIQQEEPDTSSDDLADSAPESERTVDVFAPTEEEIALDNYMDKEETLRYRIEKLTERIESGESDFQYNFWIKHKNPMYVTNDEDLLKKYEMQLEKLINQKMRFDQGANYPGKAPFFDLFKLNTLVS